MPTTTVPLLPTSKPDPESLGDAHRLYDALNELLRVAQFRDRDRACCYDVSVTQCYALKMVVDDGPLTVNELAGQLYLDKSTASRVAEGLRRKGYVGRERDGADGRIVRLRATDAGRALCVRIEDDLAAAYAEMLEDFDASVREAIIRLVSRLAASFAARVETSGGSCCVVR
jgi:MarR family 2-MHQ and catechol resistance regulon transcriptional repressor